LIREQMNACTMVAKTVGVIDLLMALQAPQMKIARASES